LGFDPLLPLVPELLSCGELGSGIQRTRENSTGRWTAGMSFVTVTRTEIKPSSPGFCVSVAMD
jgi:hypothetical protein